MIKQAVLAELPDVLCLQEVQSKPGGEDRRHDHASWFLEWLSARGYESRYGRKLGAVQTFCGGPQSLLPPEWEAVELQGIHIGNLTAWKRECFELVHSVVVPLAVSMAAACSDKSTAECLSERNSQVLILTTLEHKATRHRILLGNTHLTAPRGERDYERKLIQTQQMAAALAAFAKALRQSQGEARTRAVFAGDFNATPDSELYELVATGGVEKKRMQMLLSRGLKGTHGLVQRLPFESPTASGLELESTQRVVMGEEPPYTNYTESFKGCLDYVTSDPKSGIRCTAVGELPPESKLSQETALPNSEHPSDHLPVLCRMELEPLQPA